MTRPDLPRLVEQTRALLLLQMYMTVLVLFFMTLLMRFLTSSAMGARGDRFVVIFVTLACIPVALGLSAMLFRRGWALGWMLALVAELATLVVAIASILGPFAGLAAIILFVVGSWSLVNLFRAEVRRFFFG
ncbi:hypothetical protein [Actinoplanes sp. NPDC049118]|uniref:hypothetical protein n=1 Tax=Actinoplanes sp. NPDC049118 TaxID=3155769 RepID=UPI0033D5E812